MSVETSRRWLVGVGLLVTGFGAVMALASGTPLFDLFNRWVDPAFWSDGPVDPGTVDFQAWVYGAWGATLAGWGLVVTLLAREAFGRGERWAWWALASGVSVWFALDTTISLIHGVIFNVALNVVLFVLITVPLVATRNLATRR